MSVCDEYLPWAFDHPMSGVDLSAVIADATAVRVSRVGDFDPRHRRLTKFLLLVSAPADVTALRQALAIAHSSLSEEISLMTPGAFDFHFFRGPDLQGTVTYLPHDFIRWRGWRFDARLQEWQQLSQWLKDRGWSGTGAEFTVP